MLAESEHVQHPSGCYWCGNPATSREHVPPSNLFPRGHNSLLITVPSCKQHNEDLHSLDERFRVYLQVQERSNSVALEAFKDKTFRGLSRPERSGLTRSLAEKSHRVTIGEQPTLAMEIDPKDQNLYFEKIIRGIYFHLFKTPALGRVVSISKDFIVPDFNYEELMSIILPPLNDPRVAVVGKTENSKVFQFKYAHVREETREAFAIVLRFYEGVEVFGFVTAEPEVIGPAS